MALKELQEEQPYSLGDLQVISHAHKACERYGFPTREFTVSGNGLTIEPANTPEFDQLTAFGRFIQAKDPQADLEAQIMIGASNLWFKKIKQDQKDDNWESMLDSMIKHHTTLLENILNGK